MAAAGEASTTVLRFFSFIGAGGTLPLSPRHSRTHMFSQSGLNSSISPVICTKAINTYLDYERKQEAAAAAEAAAVAAASSSNAVVAAADAPPASAVAAAKP
jgi:hypothetical protein